MRRAEKGDLLHSTGHTMGRGKISTQSIFTHLQGINMSFRFKQTKNWRQGERGMHKQSQSQM
jgi:hypothetical protein